jgi:hypothetical protein
MRGRRVITGLPKGAVNCKRSGAGRGGSPMRFGRKSTTMSRCAQLLRTWPSAPADNSDSSPPMMTRSVRMPSTANSSMTASRWLAEPTTGMPPSASRLTALPSAPSGAVAGGGADEMPQ